MFMMMWVFMGMFVKLHYDLSYETSIEELASVIGLIASSSTSRETLVPDGKLGEADNAYTVNVYTLIPGPFEHGGAYAS
jgi:hypothetical protein